MHQAARCSSKHSINAETTLPWNGISPLQKLGKFKMSSLTLPRDVKYTKIIISMMIKVKILMTKTNYILYFMVVGSGKLYHWHRYTQLFRRKLLMKTIF